MGNLVVVLVLSFIKVTRIQRKKRNVSEKVRRDTSRDSLITTKDSHIKYKKHTIY